jgi:large subunit ribosomal protein L22
MAKVTATLKNLRMSPRKVRLVTDSIVGMDVNAAFVQLDHVVKKTSGVMEKLLSSALANAENNFGMDRDNMFISSILVGEGARLKRWLPRAQGRATQILKRTSHIKLELEEKVEGKNRKSKQELEKERAKRQAEKEKMIKEATKELEEAEKEEKEEADAQKASAKKVSVQKETAKKGQDRGFLKKVFQRKSA